MKKHYFLLAAMLTISLFIQAQNELFLKKEFIYKGDTLRYRVEMTAFAPNGGKATAHAFCGDKTAVTSEMAFSFTHVGDF